MINREKQREYQAKWYQKHKTEQIARTAARRRIWKKQAHEYIIEYLKTHHCTKCGITNPMVLEFHHRDSKTKKMDVGAMLSGGWPFEMIKKEIEKCDVLCANCHRIESAEQQGWYKSFYPPVRSYGATPPGRL